MSGKYRDQSAATLSDDAAERHADVLVEGDDAPSDVFVRLAETVPALGAHRNGAIAVDPWAAGPEREEVDDDETEAEAEKEAVPLEEQEGVDDPVRMYLREIGKVYLLSGADEKRLARQMEEAKHIDAIEKRWIADKHRAPSGQEILLTL